MTLGATPAGVRAPHRSLERRQADHARAAAFRASVRSFYGFSYNEGQAGAFGGYAAPGHWENSSRWRAAAAGIFRVTSPAAGVDWNRGLAGWRYALDVGCGRGALVEELRACWSGLKVVGVDLADVRRSDCAVGDALELPFRSGSFSLVLAFDVVEHVAAELQDLVLAELGRVLRPGGVVFATVPTSEPWYSLSSKAGPRNHYLCLSPAGWAEHFNRHGFGVVAYGEQLSRFGAPFALGVENYPFALRRGLKGLRVPELERGRSGAVELVKVVFEGTRATYAMSDGVKLVPGVNEVVGADVAERLVSSGVVRQPTSEEAERFDAEKRESALRAATEAPQVKDKFTAPKRPAGQRRAGA